MCGAGVVVRLHLESQARPDLLLKDLGDRPVEVRQDLHGELGIDAVRGDQIVEGICQGGADATFVIAVTIHRHHVSLMPSFFLGGGFALLPDFDHVLLSRVGVTNIGEEGGVGRVSYVPATTVELVEILRGRHCLIRSKSNDVAGGPLWQFRGMSSLLLLLLKEVKLGCLNSVAVEMVRV